MHFVCISCTRRLETLKAAMARGGSVHVHAKINRLAGFYSASTVTHIALYAIKQPLAIDNVSQTYALVTSSLI